MKPKYRSFHLPSVLVMGTFAVAALLPNAAHAQSGTWTSLTSAGLWSNAANWSGGTVANGSGNTADFSTVDLPAGAFTVNLDSARTIGSLTFGDTDTLTAGTWTVANNAVPANILTLAGTPVITINANTTISGVIGGTTGYTKEGTGTLNLTADNSAALTGAGTILLKAGTVSLVTGSATNLQRAIGATTNTVAFEGGTLILNGSNVNDNGSTGWGPFANPVSVASGQTGTIRAFVRGSVTSTITGAGTLNYVVRATRGDFTATTTGFTGTLNVSSQLSPTFGDFRVNKANELGSTKLHLNTAVYMQQAFNPPNGGVTGSTTTQSIGQLTGDVGSVLAGNPVGGRFVNWQIGSLNTDTTFNGTVANAAGACRIVKVGTGSLTLTGNNTYTGNAPGVAGTQVNAGTLSIGNGGATGSLANTDAAVALGATLIFNRDNTSDSVYPGILSGAGSVIKDGTGKVSFSGVNTYTAGTLIKGGTLGITNSSSLGEAAGAVSFTTANGGIEAQAAGITSSRNFSVATGLTATFTSSAAANSHDISGVISGDGAVVTGGPGLTTFSGANTYLGSTTISSGTFSAANTTGSATSAGAVALNGGNLAGTGTIAGAVTAATGTGIKPGAVTPTTSAVGTLTTGQLALAGGTTLYTEFASTSSYDKVVVTGTNGLTSSASLANPVLVDLRSENSVAKWNTSGVYNLFQFAGTFSGSPNDLFEVSPGSILPNTTYVFGVSGNFITLTITATPPAEWIFNGDGLWSESGKWLSGIIPTSTGDAALFGSAITGPATVTLDSTRTVGSLTFNNGIASYTIDGASTLNINQTVGNAQVNVNLGDHTISAPVQLADSIDFTLLNAADSLSFNGIVSGAGGIIKTTVGDLTLGGNNTFGGDVTFTNGILTFADGGIGLGTTLNLDNASLVWQSGNSQDISGKTITFGANPITFSMDDDVTLANDFGSGGAAAFTKNGIGNLTLAADTTFPGAVTILNGGLTLGNGGAGGSVLGAITNNGTLTVNRSDAFVLNNLISGTGTFTKQGTNQVTLTAANTFSGITTITDGILTLNNALALQNSSLNYVNPGTLTFGSVTAATIGGFTGSKDLALENAALGAVALTVGGAGGTGTYSGILSGPGSLTKAGAGALTLSGVNTYAGATNIAANGGTLEIPLGGSISTTTVGTGIGTRLLVNGGSITASGLATIDNRGFSTTAGFNLISGTATFNGGMQTTGNDGSLISVEGGTFSTTNITLPRTGISGDQPTGPVPADAGNATGFVVSGGAATLSGILNIATSNSGATALVSGGSLSIAGAINVGNSTNNRWSIFQVSGGTFTSTDTVAGLVLAPSAATPNKGQAKFSGGVSTIERVAFGASGSQAGIGVFWLNGGEVYIGAGGISQVPVSFTSTVRLSGGILGAKASWTTTLPITLDASTTFKAADASAATADIGISGVISGGGSLTKSGVGTLTLSGLNTYTGATEVLEGTLTITNDDVLENAAEVYVTTGSVLNLTHAGIDTVAAFYVDGLQPVDPVGTYGAIGSGADHEVAEITGTGKLYVAPADPFITWADGFGLTGDDALPGADPDFDGQINALEFALNSNPTTGAASGKVRSTVEDVLGENALTYTLPVRAGAVFTGATSQSATVDQLTYTIEGSDALTGWDTMIISEVTPALSAGLPAVDTGWEYRTFRTPGAVTADPTDFIRCKVQK